MAAVFVGGFAGGLARYTVTGWDAHAALGFPWGLLVVNSAGAFALAALLVLLAAARPSRYARPLIGTGVLGSITTFSTVTVTVDQQVADGRAGPAVVVLLTGLLVGLAATVLGVQLGRTVVSRVGVDGHARLEDPGP